MQNLEKEILSALGSGEEKRGKNRTIPLQREILDNPLQFVHYNPVSYDRTLRRLGYYSIFLSQTQGALFFNPNYCMIPASLLFDTNHTLILYADLVQPSHKYKVEGLPPYGLAVCSFSLGECLSNETPTETSQPCSYTLDIAQIQSGFRGEKEMFHYLGFIRYADLFAHVVEQVAWRLRFRRKLAIEHVSLQKEMFFDLNRAISHIQSGTTLQRPYPEAVIDAELARIQATRAEWASQKGYAKTLGVNTKDRGEHVSFGKSVEDIVPDRRLQAHLAKLAISNTGGSKLTQVSR